mgnify:CR=1 FL=1
MKKLSAACMILGLSLFAGGCSNDQIDDHIISLQDKISDVTASDSAEQEDQEPSTEERVIWMRLPALLLDFDGTHLYDFQQWRNLMYLMFPRQDLNANTALYPVIRSV